MEPVSTKSLSTTTMTSTMTTTKVADTKSVVKPPQVIPTENGAHTGNNTALIETLCSACPAYPTNTPKNPDG